MVRLVAEAICLYLNKTPSYDNFKSLMANPSDFIQKLKQYNIDNVSEYTMKQLKKYIDDPGFTPENIKKYSSIAFYLSAWVISVYHYAVMINQV